MKITRFVYLGLLIYCFTAGNSAAQEVGDPDSDADPDSTAAAPVPPGWGDSLAAAPGDDQPDNDNEGLKLKAEPNDDSGDAPKPAEPAATAANASGAPVSADEADKWHQEKFARLQGLNKVTAKTLEIKADLAAKTKFGNLEILADKCLRGPENERSDNAVLLTIWDGLPGQEKKQVFHGWMFSSSPAISALEHPIYDVILLGCGEAPVVTIAPTTDGKKPAKKAKKQKAEID